MTQTTEEFIADFVKSQGAYVLGVWKVLKGRDLKAKACELSWSYDQPFPHEAVQRVDAMAQ